MLPDDQVQKVILVKRDGVGVGFRAGDVLLKGCTGEQRRRCRLLGRRLNRLLGKYRRQVDWRQP